MKTKKIRNFNRSTAHRKSMFNNLVKEFKKTGHLNTTLPKAKVVKSMVEGEIEDKVMIYKLGKRSGDNAEMARLVTSGYLKSKFSQEV